MKHVMKLTERQRRFVEAFIETGNATEAAVLAGYSKKTAYSIGNENLKKPELKRAIEERMKEIEALKTATAEEVIQFLSASMRGEVKEEVIITEGTGIGMSKPRKLTKQISARDRIKAAELLLKRYPMKPEAEEQQLRIAKLKAEIDRAAESVTESVTIEDNPPNEEVRTNAAKFDD